jgi:nucleotide-binding universal stress UspA family protein
MQALLATDGSAGAGVALDLARGLRWPAGSRVRIVTVVPSGAAVFAGPWPAVALLQADAIASRLWQAATETVEQERERLERPGLDVSVEVLRGRPATAIVEAASRMRADLVIVGSRGHGAIESMLLGSVSAEVVDHATVPVLVARRADVDRVVLGWDGSPCSRVAADLVAAWPVFAGSSVRVVSVAESRAPWWAGVPEFGAPEVAAMFLEIAEASRREHDALAQALRTELREAGLDAEAERREGDPAAQLMAAAVDTEADLIVVGTHGRTGLSRALLGSVARNVLLHAPCSVLVARGAPAGEPAGRDG